MSTQDGRIRAETALINTLMGISGGALTVQFLMRILCQAGNQGKTWNYTVALNGALAGAVSQVGV